jgi:hypothetical protein
MFDELPTLCDFSGEIAIDGPRIDSEIGVSGRSLLFSLLCG